MSVVAIDRLKQLVTLRESDCCLLFSKDVQHSIIDRRSYLKIDGNQYNIESVYFALMGDVDLRNWGLPVKESEILYSVKLFGIEIYKDKVRRFISCR